MPAQIGWESREANGGATGGRVCLVGAGPGDPELLTIKAANRIRSANVILHDDLVSPAVLALASPQARIVNVGKRCGQKRITQSEINLRMIQHAAEGELVVRLKSGDPLIFGRGGEEIEALRDAGVNVEIVSGVTAAMAAAAAAQVSLTDRRCADHVVMISAHQARGNARPDWQRLISARATILVYMPGDYASLANELLNAGVDACMPCLVVSRISQPVEQHYRTILRKLRDLSKLPAPSLLIMGPTIGLSAEAECRASSIFPYCNDQPDVQIVTA